ncbi:uncharacterized protein LOC129737886 [Uranotaenia lowii]|uniref:uncharacterized protein LOC129737886 n=1 Tax=Uranotaenia lowii TaxID=190385 RepID=UPI00247A94A3|nr:uncharacterized protein LOC129737886 [Uranotaenia lowii]
MSVDGNPPWGSQVDPPGRSNRRTMPSWMDRDGMHGDVQFLVLKPTPNAKLPSNPFIIAKTIDQAVGRIEAANPTDGGTSYLLKVRSQEQATKLIRIDQLIDGTPVSIISHPTLNTTQCVVSCREAAGMSDKDLTEELADQGITRVYRFLKKSNGKDEPTNTMVLTIRGTVPPTHVFFGYVRVPTRPYYPRPMMCYKCGKFGHTKQRCQHAEMCLACGEPGPHPDCKKDPKCLNCGGQHTAINRTCPKQQEEQSIVRIRVDLGVSQGAAIKEFQSRCAAARNASSVQLRLDTARRATVNDEKDRRIQQLEKQVAQLTALLNKHQESSRPTTDTEGDTSDSDATMTSETSSAPATPKRNRNRGSSEDRSPTSVDLKKKKPLPTNGPKSANNRNSRSNN